MKFEYNCPFNLASMIAEELEYNTNIDFITVDKPHFLFSDKNNAKIIIYSKNENTVEKILKKTLQKIHDNLTTLETNFQTELGQLV
jgi:DNA-directed RNA polymerase subunit L